MGRVLFFPTQSLSPLCTAVIGTFLLHDDPLLSVVARPLEKSCWCCERRGLQMLPPFFLVTFIGSLLDGMQILFMPAFSKSLFQGGLQAVWSWSFLGIWICEIIGWTLSSAAMKSFAPVDANYSELPANQGLFRIRTGRESDVGQGGSGNSPGDVALTPPMRASFQPFSGQAYRMGDGMASQPQQVAP